MYQTQNVSKAKSTMNGQNSFPTIIRETHHTINCLAMNKSSYLDLELVTTGCANTSTTNWKLERHTNVPVEMISKTPNIYSKYADCTTKADWRSGLPLKSQTGSSSATWRTCDVRLPSSLRQDCPSDERRRRTQNIKFPTFGAPTS